MARVRAACRYIHAPPGAAAAVMQAGVGSTAMETQATGFFQWEWWAVAALVLFIAELFVPGFFLVCLGIGCAFSALAAKLGGDSATIQLLVFSVFSLVAFFTVRPLMLKHFMKTDVKTGADAMAGRKARVTQEFDSMRMGRVSVDGDDWRAEAQGDQPLRIGDNVEVVRVESNTLVVKPL